MIQGDSWVGRLYAFASNHRPIPFRGTDVYPVRERYESLA